MTPGTLETAFSTRALHAAQLMPVTLYCSISHLLFHQLLYRGDELIDDLILALVQVAHHAPTDMIP